MEKAELRSLVFSALRSQPQTHFNGVKSRLRSLSVEYEAADDLKVHEIIWELLVQGILAPGINASNLDLPYLHVTDHGLKVLQGNQAMPYDYDGYIENISAASTRPVDPVVEGYLRESVVLFGSGHHLASTALLGIAVERCIDLIARAYRDIWEDETVRRAFDQRMVQAGRNLKQRYGLLRNALQSMNLPPALQDSIDSLLSNLYAVQRYSRDEFGKATALPVDRDVAHANLLLFPTSWNRVMAIISFLERRSTLKGEPGQAEQSEGHGDPQPAPADA